MKEQFVRACECGATVKCSDLDGVTLDAVQDVWNKLHKNHEEVSCNEATTIRTREKTRLQKLMET